MLLLQSFQMNQIKYNQNIIVVMLLLHIMLHHPFLKDYINVYIQVVKNLMEFLKILVNQFPLNLNILLFKS